MAVWLTNKLRSTFEIKPSKPYFILRSLLLTRNIVSSPQANTYGRNSLSLLKHSIFFCPPPPPTPSLSKFRTKSCPPHSRKRLWWWGGGEFDTVLSPGLLNQYPGKLSKWLAVSRGILEAVLSRMLENGISALNDQPFNHNVLVRL